MNTVWAGASIGFALRIRRVQLIPELSVLYSPVKFNGERPDEKRNGVAVASFGIAVPIDL